MYLECRIKIGSDNIRSAKRSHLEASIIFLDVRQEMCRRLPDPDTNELNGSGGVSNDSNRILPLAQHNRGASFAYLNAMQ